MEVIPMRSWSKGNTSPQKGKAVIQMGILKSKSKAMLLSMPSPMLYCFTK